MDRVSESEVTMVLDTYMYTDYEYAGDNQSLKEIVEEMPQYIDVENEYSKEYAILKSAVDNPQIGDLCITCQSRNMGFNEGTNAVSFVSPDKDKLYVIFRGTADGEWLDNANGLVMAGTPQQKEAVAYYDKVVEELGVSKEMSVYAGGHSKGANKVQYVAMESENYQFLDAVYSVDGQGHSDAAINRWQSRYSAEEYADRVDRIYAINGENDFVNVLGNNIVKDSHTVYVKTGNEPWDMAGYHDITAMFAECGTDKNGKRVVTYSGKRNPQVISRGSLSECVGAMSKEVMKLAPDQRDGSTRSLMEICEVLNGGKMTGVNGEKPVISDIFDLFKAGIPAIGVGITGREGGKLLKDILNDGHMATRITDSSSLEVNYLRLKDAAEMLDASAGKLTSKLYDMEQAGMAIPLYFNGYSFRRPHIENSVTLLLCLVTKLKKTASLQREVATIYERFDREALNMLK